MAGYADGCDTRNRVLQAQALTPAQNPIESLTVESGGCTVTGGTWYTPYEATPSQQAYTDQADIAANLPIDHLVPKKMAWQSGAYNWLTLYGAQGTQMLTDFANDLGGPELVVVSTTTNSSKGSNGPQDWMPPNTGMACAYAKMWIAVKWEWNLAVSISTTPGGKISGASEEAALQSALNSC